MSIASFVPEQSRCSFMAKLPRVMTQSKRKTHRGLKLEIVTVTSVAFLSAVVGSIAALVGDGAPWSYHLSWSHGTAIIHMSAALLVLALVWYQHGESLRSLGINWNYRVLPMAALLCIAYWTLELVIYNGVRLVGEEAAEVSVARRAAQSLGGIPQTLAVVFVVVSAAREELVGRAYLITRLEQLGWKSSSAVVFSAVLLAACHLYQGVPAALMHLPAFLLGSAYYARYRNSIVLIVSHIGYNVGSLWWSGQV